MTSYPPPPGPGGQGPAHPGQPGMPMGAYPSAPGAMGYAAPPPSYLAWGIITTLLCCLPLGIVSIVKASQVNSKWLAGDHAGAQAASASAKRWAIWAAVLGVLAGLVWAALAALGMVSTAGVSTEYSP